ncbi:hypothetical protein FAGKG844_100042 [Frankia sp. AgKG'84/4]
MDSGSGGAVGGGAGGFLYPDGPDAVAFRATSWGRAPWWPAPAARMPSRRHDQRGEPTLTRRFWC